MRKENAIRGRILKEKAQMVRVNVPLTIDGKELARSTCHYQKSATNDRLSKARINPDELKVLAKPLQEYLTSHFNPMCSVVVDVDRVTVVSRELSTPTD